MDYVLPLPTTQSSPATSSRVEEYKKLIVISKENGQDFVKLPTEFLRIIAKKAAQGQRLLPQYHQFKQKSISKNVRK